eukprot:12919490-Prorocentrum_lima.AAC.1
MVSKADMWRRAASAGAVTVRRGLACGEGEGDCQHSGRVLCNLVQAPSDPTTSCKSSTRNDNTLTSA